MNGNLSSILGWLYPQGGYSVRDPGDGGGPIIATWNAAITGVPQPTVASIMAREAEWAVATGGNVNFARWQNRQAAKKVLDADTGSIAKLLRAAAAVLVDEMNATRQWLASFKVEVAAATNLADLKVRVATLPNMPDRTLTQAKNAIRAKLDTGLTD